MNGDIVQFLISHGYGIMFLLMLLEGPIVTLVAAFLASIGIFSWPIVLAVAMIGDITGDIMLYGIGRKWGYGFVHRFGKYIGIKRSLIEKMQQFFVTHGGKTILMVKSTTGLCFVTFVAAGMAKMPLYRFLGYSFFGGIIWSGGLVVTGYFFGYLYEEIARSISWASWIILGVALLFFVSINFYKKRKADIFFNNKKKRHVS